MSSSSFSERFLEMRRLANAYSPGGVTLVWSRSTLLDNLISTTIFSEEEILRGASYHSSYDEKRFKSGRALLHLVNKLTSSTPTASAMFFSETGKVLLDGGRHVSVSYAGDFVVLAFSDSSKLGIDIALQGSEKSHAIFFQAKCRTTATNFPDNPSARWVDAEAILKSDGRGLSGGMQRIRYHSKAHGAVRTAWVDPNRKPIFAVQTIVSPYFDGYGAIATQLPSRYPLKRVISFNVNQLFFNDCAS
jgi:phosphopantetheinyl transferase